MATVDTVNCSNRQAYENPGAALSFYVSLCLPRYLNQLLFLAMNRFEMNMPEEPQVEDFQACQVLGRNVSVNINSFQRHPNWVNPHIPAAILAPFSNQEWANFLEIAAR